MTNCKYLLLSSLFLLYFLCQSCQKETIEENNKQHTLDKIPTNMMPLEVNIPSLASTKPTPDFSNKALITQQAFDLPLTTSKARDNTAHHSFSFGTHTLEKGRSWQFSIPKSIVESYRYVLEVIPISGDPDVYLRTSRLTASDIKKYRNIRASKKEETSIDEVYFDHGDIQPSESHFELFVTATSSTSFKIMVHWFPKQSVWVRNATDFAPLWIHIEGKIHHIPKNEAIAVPLSNTSRLSIWDCLADCQWRVYNQITPNLYIIKKRDAQLVLFYTAQWTCQTESAYRNTQFTNYFRNNHAGLNAADATISIPLPNGNTLWLWGDSHLDQGNGSAQLPCGFNARNSVTLQDRFNNFRTYYDKNGQDIYTRQFVKMLNENKVTYWPSGGFVRNNIAYVFYSRFEQDQSQTFGLKFTGMVVAEIDAIQIKLLRVKPIKTPNIYFGMAVVKPENSNEYYVYGQQRVSFGIKPIVAKFSFYNLYRNWQFYQGNNRWSSSPSNLATIGNEAANEYSVFEKNGNYFMLYQRINYLQCGLGREIFIAKSIKPEGPFEDPTLVYRVPDQANGEFLKTYNAQAHPQFDEGQALLISYNVNKTCTINPCSNFFNKFNADLYRPKFVNVPFSLFSNCAF